MNDHVGDINKEGADQRYDNKCLVASPISLGDGRHVGHGGGCGAHREATETGRDHRCLIILPISRNTTNTIKVAATNTGRRESVPEAGEAGEFPQLHAHQRHGKERPE